MRQRAGQRFAILPAGQAESAWSLARELAERPGGAPERRSAAPVAARHQPRGARVAQAAAALPAVVSGFR
jgi:hypothetical protein